MRHVSSHPRDTQGSREDAVAERFRLEVADAKNEKDEQGERGDDQQPAHDDVGSASTPPKANLVVPQTVHAQSSPREPWGDETSINPGGASPRPSQNRAVVRGRACPAGGWVARDPLGADLRRPRVGRDAVSHPLREQYEQRAVVVFLCRNLGNSPVPVQACPAGGGTISGTIKATDVIGVAGGAAGLGSQHSLSGSCTIPRSLTFTMTMRGASRSRTRTE
jgi:hypothetical protein